MQQTDDQYHTPGKGPLPRPWLAGVGMYLVAGGLVLLLSGCDMDRIFLFFPTADLITTPHSAGLAYEDVYFHSADGIRLHGWFVPGQPGAPLILFFHGNAGNISHRVDNLRLFHEQLGASVLIVSYRGYGRSGGSPDEAGTYADARAALAWLQRQGRDDRTLIYFGRSLGAAVATQLATEHPPAGLVLESPFTSVAEMGRHHYPVLYRLFGRAVRSSYDSLGKIDRIGAPLLILHGDQDRIVAPRMAEELFARARHPKTFHLITGAGHNDTLAHATAAYWRTWRVFIESLTAAQRRPTGQEQSAGN